ncbi:alpha/beta hydrolase-fold protein [Planctomicrobium sp. SH661]|uniref:alpha/beta hydrolase-fold protein n=1 Tax=Planctomicrobium sp. SH661 TaxID=3448124 RepID=UPI003F5B8329
MWKQVEISGRQADVFVPGAEPFAGALIYLHGYSGESLRENEIFTRLFKEHRLPVVCPQGGRCWWLDTVCPQFDSKQTPLNYILEDVTRWIEEAWKVAVPQIGLLGVSMGGQGVLNLAYRHARQFPVVAALSPAIDFDRIHGKGFGVEEIFPDAEAARQETAVLHLHPLNWPKHQFFCSDPQDHTWHAGSERLASKLMSSGVPFTSDLKTSLGGHGWPYFNTMAERAVSFLADALQSSRDQSEESRANR